MTLFDDYDVGGFYDEIFLDDGTPRPHYEQLVGRLRGLSSEELDRRDRLRQSMQRTQGVTFTVYDDDEGTERTFPLDLVPRIIPADEWDHLERGLIQRVNVLNRFLDDLYVGEQAAIHDGVVPRWLVQTASGFRRQAFGINVPHAARCLVAGVDLVRGDDGVYRVLEDNLRNPSGVSYVLENRSAMARVLPSMFASGSVRPVEQYGRMLGDALQSVAPPSAGDNIRAVVLTPGVYNSAYYEHAFLARQMGIELVEGRDLVVDDHVLYMRTTRGLARIDVVYRRIDDDFLDPVVFRPDSALGVQGLMSAARAGNVTVVNAVGNGVADDKAFYAYVPDLIRYYLDEEPILESVPTYLLWDADQRNEVLSRLEELVVKPVAEAGGYGLYIGPTATKEETATVRAAIEDDPRNWIAQEVVQLSRHPTLANGRLAGRHVDLRPFVIAGQDTMVLPGGLTRVALKEGSLVVNSSQGGGSKDTWVVQEQDQ